MRPNLRQAGLVLQSLFYLAGGINHLWHPRVYEAIMPTHYTHPHTLVQISGLAEVLGGIGLLIPAIRRVSAFGIIAMLVVYFDVHFYMLVNPDRFASIPKWVLGIRIPLQFALIAWAYVYARKQSNLKAPAAT